MIIAVPFRAARFRRDRHTVAGSVCLPATLILQVSLAHTHTLVYIYTLAHRRNVSSISLSVCQAGVGEREMDETLGPAAEPRVTYLPCLCELCISNVRCRFPRSVKCTCLPFALPAQEHSSDRVLSRCLTFKLGFVLGVTLQHY